MSGSSSPLKNLSSSSLRRVSSSGKQQHASIYKGSMEVASRLKDIRCLKMESGEMVRLGDYWEKDGAGPVIFVMLRRWGCGVCRMYAANWNLLKPVFDTMGVRMVGIGVEKLGYDEFKDGHYFDGELLVDEKKDSYSALGCGETSWRSLWGLLDGEIPRLAKLSRDKGYDNNFQGDVNQLGGTFVFSPGGALLFGHYQSSTQFEPSMPAILESLNIQAPAGYDQHTARWAVASTKVKVAEINTIIKTAQKEEQCCESSSPAGRLGRKLGLVSHVRCENLTKVVAKMTSHKTALPPPSLMKEVLHLSQEEMPSSALSISERNTLIAWEMGKRLQTPCFEQGLKTLYVVHTFMIKGHESFRAAISQDPGLLKLDKASEGLWLMCSKAKHFSTFIQKYGSYLNDLANFFALAQPYDLYAKPTITTTTTKQESTGGGTALSVSEEKTIVVTTPSAGALSHAKLHLNNAELHGLMSSALALFKSAYALTPEEATAENPISREMIKLVYFDIKLLYTFLTETFSHNIKHKIGGRVIDMERAMELYDAYEGACAEVSVFFAMAASFGIISSTPKLKPVPRSLVDKFSVIVANARRCGLDVVNWEDVDDHSIEKDSLSNVLAKSESRSTHDASEDTVGSPGGSVDAPSTEAAGGSSFLKRESHHSDPNQQKKPRQSPSVSSAVNWEEDSLADLRSASYGVDAISPTSTLDTQLLDDEPEDIRSLLTAAGAPALMVAASENSASASRRFHLLKDEVLGKGGFGTVFKAWDKQEGMYAAVKEITVDTKQTNIAELFGEFRTATEVSHQNIVRTLMFSLTDTTGSIFMEWLPAGSLHQVLSHTKAPFGEHLIRRYIRDSLTGLEYLHERGIVHRDIKLSNLLLSVGGKVKLTDFGSSKVVTMINTSMKTENIVGTVPYMAPEAVRGTYSAASDIWAIGCCIVEMLTTTHPWAETGEKDQIAMIFHIGSLQSPNHIPKYGPESAVSEELRSFLEMCFVFDYHKRPTAEKLLQHPWFQMDEEY